MTIGKETLWDKLFNRLPENKANDAIRILRRGGSVHDIDTFDVRLMADQLLELKATLKDALKAYRRHQARAAVRSYMAVLFDREGAMLRRHAVNIASLYIDLRRDYRELSALLDKAIANDPGPRARTKGGRHD